MYMYIYTILRAAFLRRGLIARVMECVCNNVYERLVYFSRQLKVNNNYFDKNIL